MYLRQLCMVLDAMISFMPIVKRVLRMRVRKLRPSKTKTEDLRPVLVFEIMHLSMVCPRMGGPGNPRELDFVKRTWVGILTSTTVPRVGNLTRPPSWKVERTWEWVSGPPSCKIPRSHFSEFPTSKDGWTKGKEYRVAFFKQKCCFLCPSVLCL